MATFFVAVGVLQLIFGVKSLLKKISTLLFMENVIVMEVKMPPGAFRGFSGRRFWIRFKDGSTLTTNNLWYQGKIPDEFRDELPDTAEFYTPDHIRFANNLKTPF